MQQTWFWTNFLIKYRTGKTIEVQDSLFGNLGPFHEHDNPRALFLETLGGSDEEAELSIADRINKACELGLDARLFFIFYPEETEVYLAKQVSIIDDVFIETGERLPRLLNAVQKANLPRLLYWGPAPFLFWPFLRVLLLHWVRLPLEARQQPSGSVVSQGRIAKFGTLASTGVWGSLAGGGLATGLAMKFGNQSWPYDVSPVLVGAISLGFMVVHIVWKRVIMSLEWRPPQYK